MQTQLGRRRLGDTYATAAWRGPVCAVLTAQLNDEVFARVCGVRTLTPKEAMENLSAMAAHVRAFVQDKEVVEVMYRVLAQATKEERAKLCTLKWIAVENESGMTSWLR